MLPKLKLQAVEKVSQQIQEYDFKRFVARFSDTNPGVLVLLTFFLRVAEKTFHISRDSIPLLGPVVFCLILEEQGELPQVTAESAHKAYRESVELIATQRMPHPTVFLRYLEEKDPLLVYWIRDGASHLPEKDQAPFWLEMMTFYKALERAAEDTNSRVGES